MMNELKELVAKKALEFLENDMIIGVGSGTTVRHFIKLLGEKIRKGQLSNIIAIPTSFDTEILLIKEGIKVATLNQYPQPDIAIDGADSILIENETLIKGGGGAFLREKLVDYNAKEFIVIVDESKLNRQYKVPIEVYPLAYASVINKLKNKGIEATFRLAKSKLGPTVTDNGNILMDLNIPLNQVTKELERELNSIPGILENGIFSRDAKILIGTTKGIKELIFQ